MQSYQTTSDAFTFVRDADKDVMYAMGYTLYQCEQYADAARCFKMLTLCEPVNASYYAALAACQKMVREYDNAMYHYALAYLIGREPEHSLKVAECQIAAGAIHTAMDTLTTLIGRSFPPSPKTDIMLKTANFWLDILRVEQQ